MFEPIEGIRILVTYKVFTNQNSIQEEIKCEIKAGISCYYLVQTLLSSRLLSKNLKKKNKTIILPFVLYGCETWSLKLREEYKIRVFKNRILRRIFGPLGPREMSEVGSTTRNFIVCTVHLI